MNPQLIATIVVVSIFIIGAYITASLISDLRAALSKERLRADSNARLAENISKENKGLRTQIEIDRRRMHALNDVLERGRKERREQSKKIHDAYKPKDCGPSFVEKIVNSIGYQIEDAKSYGANLERIAFIGRKSDRNFVRDFTYYIDAANRSIRKLQGFIGTKTYRNDVNYDTFKFNAIKRISRPEKSEVLRDKLTVAIQHDKDFTHEHARLGGLPAAITVGQAYYRTRHALNTFHGKAAFHYQHEPIKRLGRFSISNFIRP